MKVTLTAWTPNPAEHVSKCAGTSYGKTNDSMKRLQNCFGNGHLSVFEHASVSFRVEDVSRACSHQLVRHRMASFTQVSQRYTRVDCDSPDWYVMPERIASVPELNYSFRETMQQCGEAYNLAILAGEKPEDARYMLPEATKTELAVTMNWREVYHFLDLRLDKAAQWEIRELAGLLVAALWDEPETMPMIALYEDERGER